MTGPKPKASALKRLAGNPGRRPLNRNEPDIPLRARAEKVPRELRHDRRAAAEWRRLAPILRTARVLSEADVGTLIAVCQQWSLYLDAMSKVTALVVTAKSGYPMPNPYLGIANRAMSLCIKLWENLGCTPSARSRVTRTEAGADRDSFAEFDQPIRYDPAHPPH